MSENSFAKKAHGWFNINLNPEPYIVKILVMLEAYDNTGGEHRT